MEFLRELFTNYQSTESIYMLLWWLGSFFIGWLTRYFMGRRKARLLAASVDKSTLELNQVKKQREALQGQYDLKEADYKKASLSLLDKNKLVSSLESDKRGMNTRLKTTLDEYEKAKVEHTQTATRLEELNEQILGLRTKNAQLNAEIQQSTQTINQYAATQTSQEDQQELATIIARLRDQNSQLQKTNTSLKAASANANTSIEQYEALELKLAKAEAEKEELKAANTALQEAAPVSNISTESYETLQLQVEQLEAEKEQLNEALAKITQLENGNESLTTTVSTLMKENEVLKEQLEQLPQLEDGNATLTDSMTQLIDQNEGLKAKIEELQQYESGNAVLHATIAELLEKNELLQQKSTAAVGIASSAETPILTAIPAAATTTDELDTEQAKAEIRAAIGNQIKETSYKDKDDLQQINGIGPFIEEKLNDLGIYSFEQVGQLDDRLINVLTAAIEFFPGRIERDEWVGQADRLSFMKRSVASPRRSLTSKTVVTKPASESFISEKKAIQEKIIVEDSTPPVVKPPKVTRVVRREPIRRVVRRGPMPASANEAKTTSSSPTFKEAITEKLIVPPAMPLPPVVVPDTSIDQDAKKAEMLIEAHIAREKVAERAAKDVKTKQDAIAAKAAKSEQEAQAAKEAAAKKAQAEKEAAQAKAAQAAKEAQLAKETAARQSKAAKEAELEKAAKEAQLAREAAAKKAIAVKAAAQAKAAQAAREAELKAAKEAQAAKEAAAKKAQAEKEAAEAKAAKEAAAKKAQAEKEAAEAKAKRAAELKAAKEAQAAKKAAAEKEAAARAAEIQAAKETQAAKDMIAARKPISPDDLKQIEGIGPKISQLLANVGIITYEQLANQSVDQLQDILDEAGPRYRIAKPRTWPTQARMAASGDWDSLKDFQNRLRGGKLID